MILVDSLGADMMVFGLVTCLFASRYRLLNTGNFSRFCRDKKFSFSVFSYYFLAITISLIAVNGCFTVILLVSVVFVIIALLNYA